MNGRSDHFPHGVGWEQAAFDTRNPGKCVSFDPTAQRRKMKGGRRATWVEEKERLEGEKEVALCWVRILVGKRIGWEEK